MIQILETRALAPPVKNDLDAWVNTYKLTITALMDPPGVGTRTLDTYGRRENAFIVDLKTMKIVQKISGSILGVGTSSAKQLIPPILTLLAK